MRYKYRTFALRNKNTTNYGISNYQAKKEHEA